MGSRHGARTLRDETEQDKDEEVVAEKSWEYLVEHADPASDRVEPFCNRLGHEGWDLVAVIPVSRLALSSGGRTTGIQLFFKRQLL